MAPTTVAIVGASYAGLHVAHSLLAVPDVKVVLINPSTVFYWNIAAPRIVAKAKAFSPDQYLLPIANAFAKYPAESFEFIAGSATAIDATAKNVSVTPNDGDARTVSYDYLVIASGSTTASSNGSITGSSIPFKPTNHDDLKEIIAASQQQISGAKEIVIGGAGPIGIEVAGEIADAVKQSGNKVSITLVSATDRVLSMLKPSASSTAEKMLKKLNVKVINSTRVSGVEASGEAASKSWTVSLSNGEKINADLYIPTTGALPNNSFIPEQFLDQDGWVKVDKELRVLSAEKIYAAGDITNNSMRLSFKTLEQAKIAANNLKADIAGKGERQSYNQGDSVMMVVPVGESGGTGQVFGIVPFSFMVKMIKGRDYFISKAAGAVDGTA
jgi:NADH dehydrogenase FAD-containing subunit